MSFWINRPVLASHNSSGNVSQCSATFDVPQTSGSIVFGAPNGQPVTGSNAFCNDAPVVVPFTFTDTCACTSWSVTGSGGTVSFDQQTLTGTLTIPPGNTSGPVLASVSVTDCSGATTTASVKVNGQPLSEQTCYCSYTQGGWGAGCSGGNIACTRDAHFNEVYPTNLTLGNQSTRDLIFNSPKAVDNYLPNNTAPATIAANTLNPVGIKSNSYGGTLGGNLLALRLSIDFDAKGDLNRATLLLLGSLVLTSGPFAGMSLSGFEQLAEQVLAGGALPSGTSLSTFSDTLSALNGNFDGCRGNGGLLRPTTATLVSSH